MAELYCMWQNQLMGKLEEENKKIVRKTRLQEAVLITLASGGRVGSDEVIGRTLDYLLDTDFIDYKRNKEVVKSAASRLRSRGLITFSDGKYSLAKSGREILDKWQMSRYSIKQPRKWDGKWRVVIYDIPHKKKALRERVREILSAAQFKKLQNSVWVYPHDCEDVIGLMKTDLGVGRNLLYMIVDQIEDDRFLRMDFNLI